MANDFIGIDVQGIKELQAKLAKLPKAAQDAGADEAYDYLLNVLREYPPYKYVSRATGYDGTPWFSEKQRRYVMAAINEGTIVPGRSNRSQEMAKGWKKHGSGAAAFIANEVPYSGYLMGDDSQSRHMAKIGWKTLSKVTQERLSKIVEKFDAGVKKAIKRLGL